MISFDSSRGRTLETFSGRSEESNHIARDGRANASECEDFFGGPLSQSYARTALRPPQPSPEEPSPFSARSNRSPRRNRKPGENFGRVEEALLVTDRLPLRRHEHAPTDSPSRCTTRDGCPQRSIRGPSAASPLLRSSRRQCSPCGRATFPGHAACVLSSSLSAGGGASRGGAGRRISPVSLTSSKRTETWRETPDSCIVTP